MEKLIVEENGFIKKAIYQRIKKEMNKKDDYFTLNELKQFTNIYNNFNAIFNAKPWIFLNIQRYRKLKSLDF